MRFGRKDKRAGQQAGAVGGGATPTPSEPPQSVDLTCTLTPEQLAEGLEDWAWIGLEGKTPMFASHFGQVVLRADDGIWWLDPHGAELQLVWPDETAARAALATDEGQDEYLLGGLAIGAVTRGMVRRPDQIWMFTPPPAMGGGFDIERADAMDYVVGMSFMGQIMGQIRDLPDGTQVRFRITE